MNFECYDKKIQNFGLYKQFETLTVVFSRLTYFLEVKLLKFYLQGSHYLTYGFLLAVNIVADC